MVHSQDMKKVLSLFKNMQMFSFLVGMSFGAALGLGLFCYLVPHGPKAIAMLQHYTMHMKKEDAKNRANFQKLYSSFVSENPANMHHDGQNLINPYMMEPVTTEKQFLKDMILHHEAAITMAKQVLELPDLHTEVQKTANDIIDAQSKEISQMRAWMTKWSY